MKPEIVKLAFVLFFFTGCTALKPYERIYVNDPLMQMGNTSAKNFENYTHSIREGITPPGAAKSSGGCGCN
jgi:hypothetical protein